MYIQETKFGNLTKRIVNRFANEDLHAQSTVLLARRKDGRVMGTASVSHIPGPQRRLLVNVRSQSPSIRESLVQRVRDNTRYLKRATTFVINQD